MCSQEDNEYYNNRGYDREEYTPIMICDNCKEPTEVCECPWCCHCGEKEDNLVILQIKCPVSKCEDEGDKTCISCKNIHDQRHGL